MLFHAKRRNPLGRRRSANGRWQLVILWQDFLVQQLNCNEQLPWSLASSVCTDTFPLSVEWESMGQTLASSVEALSAGVAAKEID